MKLFDSIDVYFAQKSRLETLLLLSLLAFSLAYFMHVFFFDNAKSKHSKAEAQIIKIENKIASLEQYMQGMSNDDDLDFAVRTLDEEIDDTRGQKDDYDKKLALIDSNLKELSGLLFNKKNWSQFLNSITTKAEKNNITIETISNKYVDNNGSFGHVLEIGISCKGRFGDIVSFMNDMEQDTLVTDIYSSEIKIDNDSNIELISDINISVWGVNH